MSAETNPVIKIKLDHSIKVHYTMCATGDKGSAISTNGKSLLAIGRIYEVPVSFQGNMDSYNVVKLHGKYAEKIDVRNVRDGLAIIKPLVHNTLIKDGDEIGILL